MSLIAIVLVFIMAIVVTVFLSHLLPVGDAANLLI